MVRTSAAKPCGRLEVDKAAMLGLAADYSVDPTAIDRMSRPVPTSNGSR